MNPHISCLKDGFCNLLATTCSAGRRLAPASAPPRVLQALCRLPSEYSHQFYHHLDKTLNTVAYATQQHGAKASFKEQDNKVNFWLSVKP